MDLPEHGTRFGKGKLTISFSPINGSVGARAPFRLPVPWGGVVIAAAADSAYANSLSAPYNFADEASTLYNPPIRRLWPPGPV